MLKQMEEIKELRIPSIVLSTKKNMLLLTVVKRNTSLFLEDRGGLFGSKIPKHVMEGRFSAKQLCHAHCS